MTDTLHAAPTLSTLLLNALRRHPDAEAFVWDGAHGTERASYRATAELIGRMQAVFAAAGLQRGDRIGLLASNRMDGWCASQATLASGMASSALHPLGSADDQVFQLQDMGATALVVDPGAFGARAADLVARCPGLKQVFTLGPADFGRDLLAVAERIGHHGMRDLSRPDDLATVNYTGGTTGRSKGVTRSQAGFAAMTRDIASDFELPERPHYLAAAPMTHVAGTLAVPTLMRGGSIRLLQGFQPGRLLEVIEAERINLTLLVPTMVYTLLDHPDLPRTDLSSLQSLIYGASPMLPSRLVEGIERIGPVFAQLYGQTEGYPISYLRRRDHDPREPALFSSAGLATSQTTLALLDDDDRPVPTGEVGEICVRSPQVMDGYLNQPEMTASTLRNGWLHTGDMGRCDDRGYLWIVDRKKDMIVSGGFNVYPRDVEDAIATHPAVAMVAVIGIPDPKWGEAVTAMVQLRPGQTAAPEELIELVRTRKGSVQAPKRVEFISEMPRTAVGKIDKKVLRAPFWAGQQRQVG